MNHKESIIMGQKLKHQRIMTAVQIVFLLVASAMIRYLIRQIIFLYAGHTEFLDRMGSLSADLVLIGILIVVAGKSRIGLSVVPKTLSWHYVVMEVIFAIGVWGNSPENLQSALVLIYAGVITPVFEELLFRGYIWNRIQQVCNNRWFVYVVVTVLFGLWHLAYMDSIAYRVSDGLYSIMIWKVITGMCFGVLLGAVRVKSDNCFATMLVHGTLNLFAR